MNGWGLIGTGRIAEERILPAINTTTGNALVAVVSREQSRADAFARRFGARRAYTRYEDMLRDPEVTAVAIHTPNALHAEQAIAAARAGKHVFCDKPLATNLPDAQRVLDACAKAGVKLGLNFHSRFMPSFIETRRIIASGEIGDVRLIQMEASPGVLPGGRHATWRVESSLAGLGTTFSIGVHAYDILRYLLAAEVESVSTFFDTPRGVMEEINLSTLRFSNGVLAQVNVNEKAPLPYNDYVIHGSKGRITGRGLTRSRSAGELEVRSADEINRRSAYPAVNAHAASVAAFGRALAEARDPSPSGADGLMSVQLTDAMARSAWEGVHVHLRSSTGAGSE